MLTRVRTLSVTEQAQLQAALDARDYLAVDFALQTGLHALDQARIRFCDIEPVTQHRAGVLYEVAIATVGLQRRRLVPLNTRAAAILRELRPITGGDFPFPDVLLLRQRFRDAAQQAGMDVLAWRDLRPTVAARALEAGATMAEVGVLLGHLPADSDVSFWAAAWALQLSSERREG